MSNSKNAFIINPSFLNNFFEESNDYVIKDEKLRDIIVGEIKQLKLPDKKSFSSREQAQEYLDRIQIELQNAYLKYPECEKEEFGPFWNRFQSLSEDIMNNNRQEEDSVDLALQKKEEANKKNRKIMFGILLFLIVAIIIAAIIIGNRSQEQSSTENKDTVIPDSTIIPNAATNQKTIVDKPTLDVNTKVDLNPNNQYGTSQGSIGNLTNNTAVPEVIQHNQALRDNQIRSSSNSIISDASNLTTGSYWDKNGNGIFDIGDIKFTDNQITNIQTFNPYLSQNSSGQWSVLEIGKMNNAGYDFNLSGTTGSGKSFVDESLSGILTSGVDLAKVDINNLTATKDSISASMNLSETNAGKEVSNFLANFNDTKYINQAKIYEEDLNRVNLANGNITSNVQTAKDIQSEVTKSTTASGYNGKFKDYEDFKKKELDTISSSERTSAENVIKTIESNTAAKATKDSADSSFTTFSESTRNDIQQLKKIGDNSISTKEGTAYNNLATAKQEVLNISQSIKDGTAKIDPVTGNITLSKDSSVFGNNFSKAHIQQTLDAKESAITKNYAEYSTSNQNEINTFNSALVSRQSADKIQNINYNGLSNQSVKSIENITNLAPKICNLSYLTDATNKVDSGALSNYATWESNLIKSLNNNDILVKTWNDKTGIVPATQSVASTYGLDDYNSSNKNISL